MLSWLVATTLEASVLVALVILLRPMVRRTFGANIAYSLWLIPAIAIVLPARPPRPATPLDAIGGLSGEALPRDFQAAAETWTAATGGLPWQWLWLAGAAAVLSIQLVRVVRFQRLVRSTAEPFAAPPHLLELLRRYDVTPKHVFTTPLEGSPFVTGLLETRVFFPADFLTRFSVQEQRWIAQHELMHVTRGDLWLRLAAELVRAVFWFNPLVHLAVHAVRRDQEYACDEAVVSRCTRTERYEYGKALLLGACPPPQRAFLAFFGDNKERYIMLGRHRQSALRTVLGTAVCALIGVYALTSSPLSTAQVAESSPIELKARVQVAKFLQGEATLTVEAPDQTGVLQEWTVVLGSPSELRERGFNLPFFAPGPGYTIAGYRSSAPQANRLVATSVTRPDGAVWSR
jgi:beta-lactamase regulating signal transducer with metallopeptidase domain